ncbi:MAG: hypothetical protein ACQEQU_02435 [Spirochaetota bacterium]
MAVLSCDSPNSIENHLGEPVMTRQAIQGIVEQIYDEVDNPSGDVTEIIKDFFTALDMYREYGSESHVLALLGNKEPIIFPDSVHAMARGYEKGHFVTLESFIESMKQWGAYSRSNNTPINHALLTSGFNELMGKEAYTAQEIIPALILMLGHERVKRTPFYVETDPVWADGYLDPIQFYLLSCAVMLAEPFNPRAASTGVHQPRNVETYLRDLKMAVEMTADVRSFITGQIGEIIGIPLTWDEAIQAIVAASVVLNSYNLEITMDDHMFSRRWPESPSGSPNPFENEATAALTFDFVPHNDVSAFLVILCLGEELPPERVAGKPIFWTLEGTLPSHSEIEPLEGTTSAQGTVQAVFNTFDEKVPKLLRSDLDQPPAHGNVTARAKELLPGKWRSLEFIMREVKSTGLEAKHVTVQHYKFPEIQVSFETKYTYYNPTYLDDILKTHYYSTGVQMTLTSDETYYYGTSGLYNNTTLVPDCEGTELLSKIDGEIYVIIPNDASQSDVSMIVFSYPPPLENIHHVNCYDPEMPPLQLVLAGWGPFTQHAGIPMEEDELYTIMLAILSGEPIATNYSNVLGPWSQLSTISGIAVTEYTEPTEETNGVYVKVQIRRK